MRVGKGGEAGFTGENPLPPETSLKRDYFQLKRKKTNHSDRFIRNERCLVKASSRSGFVRMSACWLLDSVYWMFVRPPLIGFSAIAIAPWLSSNKSIVSLASSGWKKSNTAYANNAVFAMAAYSASLVQKVTQCCAVLLAVITVPPIITATPDTERLSLFLLA